MSKITKIIQVRHEKHCSLAEAKRIVEAEESGKPLPSPVDDLIKANALLDRAVKILDTECERCHNNDPIDGCELNEDDCNIHILIADINNKRKKK